MKYTFRATCEMEAYAEVDVEQLMKSDFGQGMLSRCPADTPEERIDWFIGEC